MPSHDIPHMQYPEAEIDALVIQAQAGERESVGQLFTLLQGRIYRYLRGRVSDDEVAADLTQTTFIEMIHALPRYKRQGKTKFSTWLFQIARFRLIDYYRKQGRTVPLDVLPEMSDQQQSLNDPIEADHVTRALQTLSEKYQTIMHLRYREDLSTAEIATILRTSTLNVRVLHHRALTALRKAMNL